MKICKRLPPWTILVMAVIGNFICCIPFMFTDSKSILSDSYLSRQLQAPSISEALLCSIIVSVPLFIDLLLDYSILSTASHETVHWISRFIFMMSLVIRSVILYTTLLFLHSPAENAILFIVLTTLRLLCILAAILYYMGSTNLENSIFNITNCHLMMLVFIAHRFFAVLNCLYPHIRVFSVLYVVLFVLAVSSMVLCGAYWTVGQRLVLKSEIGQRSKNNFVCSQFYIFSGVGEAILLLLINIFVDGVAGGVRDHSSQSITGGFYLQICVTTIITLIPGRYAKQESLAHMADTQARRAFIRHVTGELKAPLNAISVGLKGLEQTIVSVMGDKEEDMKKFGAVYELQSTCQSAMQMLNLTLKNEGRRGGKGGADRLSGRSIPLEVVATKAVPFFLATIKSCSLHAQISGNAFVYEIGLNDMQDSILFGLRDVFLYIDTQRVERVLVTFITNAINYAITRSDIKFKVDLLEGDVILPLVSANHVDDYTEWSIHSIDKEGGGGGAAAASNGGDEVNTELGSSTHNSSSKKRRSSNAASSGTKYHSDGLSVTPMLRLSILFTSSLQDVDRVYADILQFKLNQVDGSGPAVLQSNSNSNKSGGWESDDGEVGGLGLYAAKQVIELHGGTIGFNAEQTGETAFYIDLPYTRQAQLELLYLQRQQQAGGKSNLLMRQKLNKVDIDGSNTRDKNTYKAVVAPRKIIIASGAQRTKVHVTSSRERDRGEGSGGERSAERKRYGAEVRSSVSAGEKRSPRAIVVKAALSSSNSDSTPSGNNSANNSKRIQSFGSRSLYSLEEEDALLAASPMSRKNNNTSNSLAVEELNVDSGDSATLTTATHQVVKFKPSGGGSGGSGKKPSPSSTPLNSNNNTARNTTNNNNNSSSMNDIKQHIKQSMFSTEAVTAAILSAAAPAHQATKRVLLVTDDPRSVAEETLFSDAAGCGLYFGGRMGSHTLLSLLDGQGVSATVASYNNHTTSRANSTLGRMGAKLFQSFSGGAGGGLRADNNNHRPTSPKHHQPLGTQVDGGDKTASELLTYDVILVDNCVGSNSGGVECSHPVLCRRLREDVSYGGVILLLVDGCAGEEEKSGDRHSSGSVTAGKSRKVKTESPTDDTLNRTFTVSDLLAVYLKVIEEHPARASRSGKRGSLGYESKAGSRAVSRNNSAKDLLHGTNVTQISVSPVRPLGPSASKARLLQSSPSSDALLSSSKGLMSAPSLYDLTAFSYLAVKPAPHAPHPHHHMLVSQTSESLFSVHSVAGSVAGSVADSGCNTPINGGTTKRRVLIVDDSAVTRKMLRKKLEAVGFLCDEVSDGLDAVAVIERSLMHPADDYMRHSATPTGATLSKHLNRHLANMHVGKLDSPRSFRSKQRMKTPKSNHFRSNSPQIDGNLEPYTPKHVVSPTYHNLGRATEASNNSYRSVRSSHSNHSGGGGGGLIPPIGSPQVSYHAPSGNSTGSLFHTYDVVVMDFEMQHEVNGAASTKMLRDLGYCGAVIGVTAHTMPSISQQFAAAGADDVLTKPLDMRLFMATYRAITLKEQEYFSEEEEVEVEEE